MQVLRNDIEEHAPVKSNPLKKDRSDHYGLESPKRESVKTIPWGVHLFL